MMQIVQLRACAFESAFTVCARARPARFPEICVPKINEKLLYLFDFFLSKMCFGIDFFSQQVRVPAKNLA